MSAFCNSPGEQGVPVARRVGGWDSAVKGVEEVEIQEGSSRGPVTDDLQTLRSPDLASTSPTSLRIALESSPVLSLHHLGLEWHRIHQWCAGGSSGGCRSSAPVGAVRRREGNAPQSGWSRHSTNPVDR